MNSSIVMSRPRHSLARTSDSTWREEEPQLDNLHWLALSKTPKWPLFVNWGTREFNILVLKYAASISLLKKKNDLFKVSVVKLVWVNSLPRMYRFYISCFRNISQALAINQLMISLLSLSSVCALIISTFYMRYRINTLEEQLGSLTSIVDTHQTE